MGIPPVEAIAIAPDGTTGGLRVLIERLTGAAVRVTVVEDLRSAVELARESPSAPPCVLLDLRELEAGSDIEDVKEATATIRGTAAAIPHVTPIAITGEADAALIIACIRAGAGDVIDLQLEGTAAAKSVVHRVFHRQLESAGHAHAAATLHNMIEDLLKDLIRTERRSIDLEEADQDRPPAILIVEHDRALADELAERLEAAGVTTLAFASGDDAMRELETAAIPDLAVVDGIETVRRLRERHPGLPAFLMTSGELDGDLGVVGFVEKPVADLDAVVGQLAELARDSLVRTREHLYLERIKARHERVLARYRSLPR